MRVFTSYLTRTFQIDAQYFLSGGFWLLVGQGATIFSSLIVAALFAHTLSENEYGIYRYIISLSVLLSAFSLTGVGQAVMQATARGYKRFLVDSTNATLLFGLVTTAISLIGAIYYHLYENPTLAIGCLIIAFLQPASQLFINVQSQLYGNTQFVSGSLLQISKSLIVSASSLLALWLTNDIIILIFVFFLAQAISGTASYCIAYWKAKQLPFKETEYSKGISFAKHTSFRNWFAHVANQFDSIFVFQQLGAAELALYSIASLLPTHIRGSFKNIQTLLIPKYSKHDSHIVLRKFLPKRSVQFFLLLSLISIAFIAIAPYAYKFVFPSYPEATLYAQLLALSFPASVAIIPFGAMQALRMEKELYWLQLSSSFVQLAAVVVGVLALGFIGAVFARIIAQYARALAAFVLLYKKP